MTELSFLIELLLEHKLPVATKKAIKDRIREIEKIASIDRVVIPHVVAPPYVVMSGGATGAPPPPAIQQVLAGPPQAASTLAAMARHADQFGTTGIVTPPANTPIPASAIVAETPPLPPVAVIAQTPAAAQAMASRQAAIRGKLNEETGRPRKF